MKCLLVLATLLTAAVLLGAAAESTAVTYADHEKVDKGGSLATANSFGCDSALFPKPAKDFLKSVIDRVEERRLKSSGRK